VLDCCIPTARGEHDDFRDPLYMYPSLLVSIKGGGGLPLRGWVGSLGITPYTERTHSLLAPTSLLATHNSFSSRDLGASLPLSPRLYPLLQALRVQDNTVPTHIPLLDVRPRGRNQDKPVRYCVASCINIWDEETRGIYWLGSGPPGQDTDTYPHLPQPNGRIWFF